MSEWKLTDGLQNLRRQVDDAFPARDRASDGTIGDAAHQAGTSGHNPDDSPGNAGTAEWDGDADSTPEVRAWDMDSDLRTAGVTAQQVVDHIRNLPSVASVLRYIIFNRKIYRASTGWAAATYTGPSAHTEHIHFSGARTQAADNNTTFDFHLEDLVALTNAEMDEIAERTAARVWSYRLDNPQVAEDPANPGADDKPAGTWLQYVPSYGRVDSVGAKVDALAAALAAEPDVDEAAVATKILEGLPPTLAKQIVDEQAARLAA